MKMQELEHRQHFPRQSMWVNSLRQSPPQVTDDDFFGVVDHLSHRHDQWSEDWRPWKLLILVNACFIGFFVFVDRYSSFLLRCFAVLVNLFLCCALKYRKHPDRWWSDLSQLLRISDFRQSQRESTFRVMAWAIFLPIIIGLWSIIFSVLVTNDWFNQSFFFFLPKDVHQLSHWNYLFPHRILNNDVVQVIVRLVDLLLLYILVFIPFSIPVTLANDPVSPTGWHSALRAAFYEYALIGLLLTFLPLCLLHDAPMDVWLTSLVNAPLWVLSFLADAFLGQCVVRESRLRGNGMLPALCFRAMTYLMQLHSAMVLQGGGLWLWRGGCSLACALIVLDMSKNKKQGASKGKKARRGRMHRLTFPLLLIVTVCCFLLVFALKGHPSSMHIDCQTTPFSAIDGNRTLTMWCPWQNIYSPGKLEDFHDYVGDYWEYDGPVSIHSAYVHTYCRIPILGYWWHAQVAISLQPPFGKNSLVKKACALTSHNGSNGSNGGKPPRSKLKRKKKKTAPHLVLNLLDSVDLVRAVLEHGPSPLPLTIQALKQLRRESQEVEVPFGVYHFPFMHTVGTNTMPNLIPLLTGRSLHPTATRVLEGCPKVMITEPVLSNHNMFYEHILASTECMEWLWTKLKCAGYALAWYDDLCPREPYEHTQRAWDRAACNFGLCEKETVFDIYLPDLGCYRAHPMLYYDEKKCALGKTYLSHSLEATQKTMQQYEKEGIPTFLLQGSSAAHTALGTPLAAEDPHLAEYILSLRNEENAAWFANSILFFFSDHGTNYDKVAKPLKEANLELSSHDFPLFVMLVGENVLNQRPGLNERLEMNRRGVYTWYDIHETLLELLDLEGTIGGDKPGQPVSLLGGNAWKSRRTCEEAAILEGNCESWETIQSVPMDALPTRFQYPYTLDMLDVETLLI